METNCCADSAPGASRKPGFRSVFIVEDVAVVRARLVEMIEAIPGACVVGEASSPAEAIEGIARTRPHCTVMDFHLRGGNGLTVLRDPRVKACGTAVLVITNDPNTACRQVCLAEGARWFLDKSTEFSKVREIVSALPA